MPGELLNFEGNEEEKESFSIAHFIENNKATVFFVLLGLILVGSGVFLYKNNYVSQSNAVEVLDSATPSDNNASNLVVEVSGAVKSPGVYSLENGSRVEDAIVAAGGLSETVDVEKMTKLINRAAKVADGQKILIPEKQVLGDTSGNQSNSTSANNLTSGQGVVTENGTSHNVGDTSEENPININTASQSELESLWGIGPVTAQKIIEQRPYSSVEELLSKKILKSNVYDRDKDLLTVY